MECLAQFFSGSEEALLSEMKTHGHECHSKENVDGAENELSVNVIQAFFSPITDRSSCRRGSWSIPSGTAPSDTIH